MGTGTIANPTTATTATTAATATATATTTTTHTVTTNTNINTTTISASVAGLTNGSRVQLILPTLLLKSLKKYYHNSYNY